MNERTLAFAIWKKTEKPKLVLVNERRNDLMQTSTLE